MPAFATPSISHAQALPDALPAGTGQTLASTTQTGDGATSSRDSSFSGAGGLIGPPHGLSAA
jgi:hypothetical protein